jgi:hypothetical protein
MQAKRLRRIKQLLALRSRAVRTSVKSQSRSQLSKTEEHREGPFPPSSPYALRASGRIRARRKNDTGHGLRNA